MYCLQCGKQIDDNTLKCPFCDCPTENSEKKIDVAEVSTSKNSKKAADIFGIVGIVLEIIGLLLTLIAGGFGVTVGFYGLIAGIIGLVMNRKNRFCAIATILSTVSIVAFLIVLFLSL